MKTLEREEPAYHDCPTQFGSKWRETPRAACWARAGRRLMTVGRFGRRRIRAGMPPNEAVRLLGSGRCHTGPEFERSWSQRTFRRIALMPFNARDCLQLRIAQPSI